MIVIPQGISGGVAVVDYPSLASTYLDTSSSGSPLFGDPGEFQGVNSMAYLPQGARYFVVKGNTLYGFELSSVAPVIPSTTLRKVSLDGSIHSAPAVNAAWQEIYILSYKIPTRGLGQLAGLPYYVLRIFYAPTLELKYEIALPTGETFSTKFVVDHVTSNVYLSSSDANGRNKLWGIVRNDLRRARAITGSSTSGSSLGSKLATTSTIRSISSALPTVQTDVSYTLFPKGGVHSILGVANGPPNKRNKHPERSETVG
jgi:hypothetical protein